MRAPTVRDPRILMDVVEGEGFAFEWGRLTVPRDATRAERAVLRAHASLYHTYFPRTARVLAVLERVCRSLAGGRQDAGRVLLSAAVDALVAHKMLSSLTLRRGELYLRVLKDRVLSLYPAGIASAVHGALMALRRSGTVTSHQLTIARVLTSGLSPLMKAVMLAVALRPLLDSLPGTGWDRVPWCLSGALSDPSAEADAVTLLAELPDSVLESLVDGGYSPTGQGGIEFSCDPVVSLAVLRRIRARAIRAVSPLKREPQERFLEQWVPGDDPSRLSVRDTLRTFGVVMPPIASLKRGGDAPSGGRGRVEILMDVSGSMVGDPAFHCRVAAATAVEAARLAMRPVAITFFHHDHLRREYGMDHDGALMDVARVIYRSHAGTGAIEDALRGVRTEGASDLILMTDAYITDMGVRERVLHLLEGLSERMRVSVLLLGNEGNDWVRGEGLEVESVVPSRSYEDRVVELARRWLL